MRRWEFDKKYLAECLEKINESLKKDHDVLTFTSLKSDQDFLKDLIEGRFKSDDNLYISEELYEELDLDDESFQLDFDDLKKIIINKAYEFYSNLGIRTINLLIRLYEDKIFYVPSYIPPNNISFDEQVEYTIKNYEKHSRALLDEARKVIFPEGHSLIQVVDDPTINSICFFSHHLNTPFLVINPTEGNSIINHEVEHASEFLLGMEGIYKYEFLCEFGSIYFELLFCDLLFENTHSKYSFDFSTRVGESSSYLETLYPFFKLVLELKKRNFDVDDNTFDKLCEKCLGVSREALEYYVDSNINNDDFDDKLKYLICHLKAIELRDITRKSDKDSLELLTEYYTKPLTYRKMDDKVLVYKRYLSEIENKR